MAAKIALIASALATLAAAACSGQADSAITKPKPSEAEALQPSATMDRFQLSVYRNGQIDYRLDAKKAFMLNNQAKAKLNDVGLVQYEVDKESAWVSARTGTYYLQDVQPEGRIAKDVVLQGQVNMRRADGFAMQTEEALYQGTQRTMLSKSETHITMPLNDSQILVGDCREMELLRPANTQDMIVHLRGSGKAKAHANIKPRESPAPSAPEPPKAK